MLTSNMSPRGLQDLIGGIPAASLTATQGDQPLTSAGSGCSAAINSAIPAAISSGRDQPLAQPHPVASGRIRSRPDTPPATVCASVANSTRQAAACSTPAGDSVPRSAPAPRGWLSG